MSLGALNRFRGTTLRRGRPDRPARGKRHKRHGLERARLSFDVLEDRRLMSVTTPVETVYRDLVSVAVVDRRIFYNNSIFDGAQPAANAADDGAIASDKAALLPGGIASTVNYTSYSRGINGLMIDVAGLPTASLTASDFIFRVGNSNDPATWTAAPAPTSISVRSGAGLSGSARVEVVWADGAIKKEWLQVTLSATPSTGLATADVFYFGNAIGETLNSASDAIVDGIDQGATHNNVPSAALITSPYDFNRDGAVAASDEAIVNSNTTTQATALQLIAPPALAPVDPPERLQTSLFNWGDGGFQVYNNPALVTTVAGTVLAFAEGRSTTQDGQSYAIVMRRSTDGGLTWSVPSQVYGVTPGTNVVISQPAPVVDKVTGDVFLAFSRGWTNPVSAELELRDVLIAKSSDDGLTWSAPQDITASVKVTAGSNPGPPGVFPDTPWGWIIVGPGHGIQLERGLSVELGGTAGRLLIAGDHRNTPDVSGKSWSHVIYSDDHGQTWKLGGGLVGFPDPAPGTPNPPTHANDYSNENSLVELADGSVYMSIRVQNDPIFYRGRSRSLDGGISWSNMQPANELSVHQVEGSVIRLNDHVLLFSSPYSTDGFDEFRHEMSIWVAYENPPPPPGSPLQPPPTWTKRKVVFFGYAGYSDMTVVGPDTILLSFARGWLGGLGQADSQINSPDFKAEIGLVRINLRWLESTEPYEFNWYFNEKEPGNPANHSGPSLQDYGPWDQRAWARSNNAASAAQYVPGVVPGDSALQLTNQPGANGIVLSQVGNNALQAGTDDSFTVQIMMKTTDDTGVIIGTRDTIRNWTLQIVGGKVQFSLYDTENTPVITSLAAINDGQWHHIAAVRDAAGRLLKLYVDRVEAAPSVVDTATKAPARLEHVWIDPMYFGVYNTLSSASKLDVTVDTLRFTRAALAPESFFPTALVPPSPPPPPTYLPNNPTSLPGLQLWLPAYDPTRYFSDSGSFANPLPLVPFDGMSTRSIIEASPNGFRVQIDQHFRQVLYAHDSVIGPYWVHKAKPNATFGSEWLVHNPALGTVPNQFDFVQNTGVFTLSTFVNIGAATGGYMTIFDTSEASNAKAGFSLFVQQNGLAYLTVTGGTAETIRFNASAPSGAMTPGQWYHLAVVGNGPGNPVKFYVTPVSASNVTSFNSTSSLTGDNGTYATDLRHMLFVGGRSNTQFSGAAPFNGGLVNETIFNQALTQAQIQQLFLFGKGLTSVGPPWQNSVEPLDVNNNARIQAGDALLIISRLLANPGSELPEPTPGFAPPPYYDTNGDGRFNSQDALAVISWLLSHPGGADPQVSPAVSPLAASSDGNEPQAAALSSVVDEGVVATAAFALDAPNVQDTSEVVSSFQSRDTSCDVPATTPGASALLMQSRDRSRSAARVGGSTSRCAAEGPQASSWAADEYFRSFARFEDETSDCDLVATLVNAARACRLPRSVPTRA
jgi:hypothetical protein